MTDEPAAGHGPSPLASLRRRLLPRPEVWCVLLLALGARLAVILTSPDGLHGLFGYDSGVYYAGADALTHGRMPYTDFVLVHPPGILLAVAPFAVIGRLTTDHTGFVLANLAFALVAAINAALVVQVARRLGCVRWAAAAGGVFYAVWFGAVNAEFGIRLEPISNTVLLLGLLAVSGAGELTRRRAVLAGLAFGAACCVKIWWIVPLAVVLTWTLAGRRTRRAAPWLLLGAAGSAVVIAGPFFVRAPRAMWRMLVTDQVTRGRVPMSQRLDDLTGIGRTFPHLHGDAHRIAVTAAVALTVLVLAAAATYRPAALVSILLVVQLGVLLGAPSYYPSYADYAAVALAVVVAVAGHVALRAVRSGVRWPAVAGVAAVAVLAFAGGSTAASLFARPNVLVAPFPGHRLAAAVRHVRCVTSDDPEVLIHLDALDRAFRDHCPTLIDVTGLILDLDGPGGRAPFLDNRPWQRAVRRYLLDGDACIIVRARNRLSPATITAVERHAALVTVDGRRIYDLHRPRR